MHITKIKKRSGAYRLIYAPDRGEKRRLRALLPELQQLAEQSDVVNCAHGFRTGRSPITNALRHIGYDYTLSMDLADWFDSVTAKQLAGKMPDDLLAQVLVDGATRQGLPPSPVVANIAAAELDVQICQYLDSLGIDYAYTRYADDLAISIRPKQPNNACAVLDCITTHVAELVAAYGWRVNPDKTHVQAASAGRRIITGVAVDDRRAYPSRKLKRKLRAAEHRAKRLAFLPGCGFSPGADEPYKRSAAGLREAAKLKLPGGVQYRQITKRRSGSAARPLTARRRIRF